LPPSPPPPSPPPLAPPSPTPSPPPRAPHTDYADFNVTTIVAYSVPPNTSVTPAMLQNATDYLTEYAPGVSQVDATLIRILSPPTTRRSLQKQPDPTYVTDRLDLSECDPNNSIVLVEMTFSTNNESTEKTYYSEVRDAPYNNLYGENGTVCYQCSKPEITSVRYVVAAPSPPNAPPPPLITATQLNDYGTILIGSSGIFLLLFGLCGHRILAGGIRRRRKRREETKGDAEQSLLGGVGSVGLGWG